MPKTVRRAQPGHCGQASTCAQYSSGWATPTWSRRCYLKPSRNNKKGCLPGTAVDVLDEAGAGCPTAHRTLLPLNRSTPRLHQILPIECLTDQRLDYRLSANIQLFGSRIQFFQHTRS